MGELLEAWVRHYEPGTDLDERGCRSDVFEQVAARRGQSVAGKCSKRGGGRGD